MQPARIVRGLAGAPLGGDAARCPRRASSTQRPDVVYRVEAHGSLFRDDGQSADVKLSRLDKGKAQALANRINAAIAAG